MQMTLRDERMLEWLQVVRLADMDAVRWALAGFDGATSPVSLRRAQQWVARLVEAGLLDRGRPTFRDGSIVWATYQVTGKARPNLFKQTTRHEVAVAAVSARFVAAGYAWRRGRVPPNRLEHMADGAARAGERVTLVEVELTTKTLGRYQTILPDHARRVGEGEVDRVVYVATPEAARAIAREATKWVHPGLRGRMTVFPALDVRGHLTDTLLLSPESADLVDAAGAVPPPPPVAQLPVWGGRD